MAIKTGRAESPAHVIINYEKCTVCGRCIEVCKGAPLYLEGGNIQIDQTRVFGCMGCGHCMAVCPLDCIRVEGRELSPSDIISLPEQDTRANYEQLLNLMLSRRSIREFNKREVEQEKIDKIIIAASTSPMGLPPSDVEITVFKGREKVSEFATDMVEYMQSKKWMFSVPALWLMRPFMGKESYEVCKSFIKPLFEILTEQQEQETDWLMYNAPLALLFHVSPYADPVDPMIPATYAMLAAESLGLGSCMIGTVAPMLKYSKRLKDKYGVPHKNIPCIALIIGYTDVKYHRAIKRTFAGVNYY